LFQCIKYCNKSKKGKKGRSKLRSNISHLWTYVFKKKKIMMLYSEYGVLKKLFLIYFFFLT